MVTGTLHQLDRQGIKMNETLDTALGPETKDNIKVINFLKSSKLYNLI